MSVRDFVHIYKDRVHELCIYGINCLSKMSEMHIKYFAPYFESRVFPLKEGCIFRR